MATNWPLLVEVDCPEPRPDLGRVCVGADGTSWDRQYSTGWFDSVTMTAMPAPLPVTEGWSSNYAGLYARVPRSAYTLTTGSVWKQMEVNASGDYYLTATTLGTANAEWVSTTASYGVNQGWYISAYVPNWVDASPLPILRVQWGYGGANTIELVFRANGSCIVYKNGIQKGVYDQSDSNKTPGRSVTSANAVGQRNIALMMIPFKRRELLVTSTFGANFSHLFEDLNDAVGQTIVPSGSFAWRVPYGRPTVQIAPIACEETGVFYSKPIKLRYAPPTGATFVGTVWSDVAGTSTGTITEAVTLVDAGNSPYTPDGVIDTVRLKLTVTTPSPYTRTSGVAAAMATYTPAATSTADEPVDITQYIDDLTLSVDETSRTTLRMTARRAALITAGVQQPQITSDRPIRVALSDSATPTPTYIDIFRGTLAPPQIQYEQADLSLNFSKLQYEGQDRSRDFELYYFQDGILYDGYTGEDAIGDMMTLAGYPPATYLEYDDATGTEISRSPDIARGYSSFVPQRGDTIASMLNRLKTDYCANFITGWSPTTSGYKFQWANPIDLTTTSVMTLYQTVAAAASAGVPGTLQAKRVVRRMTAHYESPECNQVTVIGQDPRNGDLLASYEQDPASQDATTLPADRPYNWRGRPVPYILSDPAITSASVAYQATISLKDRLMTGRILIEWESDFLVLSSNNRPLWVRDVVTIMQPDGTTVKGVYRIIAIPTIEFVVENGAVQFRKAVYRGVYLSGGPE
jgi:hypothetical protein